MKRIIITLLFLFLITSIVAQRPAGDGNFSKIKITGNVIDIETQEILEYATISLVNERFPKQIQGGITDAKGNFNIEIFPGEYNITIAYHQFRIS